MGAVKYRIKRNFYVKCTCGNHIFVGLPTKFHERKGYCRCGLAWNLTKDGKTYAKPTIEAQHE